MAGCLWQCYTSSFAHVILENVRLLLELAADEGTVGVTCVGVFEQRAVLLEFVSKMKYFEQRGRGGAKVTAYLNI